MKNDYFHRVARLTPTKLWINNVTPDEAGLAIEAGAMGCTQNPSYAWKMLNHPEYKKDVRKLLAEAIKETPDNNEVACILQRKLIARVAEKFMPLFEKTNGEHGYVSIQGDPVNEHHCEVILKEARINRQISPNIMIKIPATKAGLEAMEVLIAENTPLNATEVMGMSQVVALCELYKEVTTRTRVKPVMYLSLITGIFDEWLAGEVQKNGIEISTDILHQAGMAVAKKVYNVMHDRCYEPGFIGGGMRKLYHFTEMIGGDVCITMNWQGHADKLLELDQPVVSRLFNPVQEMVIETLLEKLPQFRQAYFENGLTVPEFEKYGPVVYFWEIFVSAWKNVIEEAEKLRSLSSTK